MRSIRVHNEFVNGVIELGKKYKITDDFYYELEGVIVGISKYFVCTDGDVSVEEIENVVIRPEDTWDNITVLVDNIFGLSLVQWLLWGDSYEYKGC